MESDDDHNSPLELIQGVTSVIGEVGQNYKEEVKIESKKNSTSPPQSPVYMLDRNPITEEDMNFQSCELFTVSREPRYGIREKTMLSAFKVDEVCNSAQKYFDAPTPI
jgi:hypothetical protein